MLQKIPYWRQHVNRILEAYALAYPAVPDTIPYAEVAPTMNPNLFTQFGA